MYRRTAISLGWLALYAAASCGMGLTGYFFFWQALVLLLPAAALAVAIAWNTPYPDFNAPQPAPREPIEDGVNPARKVLWLNGPWEFSLEKETRWHRVMIPRPWNVIRGLEYYDGKAVFRRVFTVPKGWSQGGVYLIFEGVNYRAVVSLDGRRVGSHEGGFTPFSLDITDRVADDGREHELEVEVDNRMSASTVPNVIGWNNDGGIFREVRLETRNRIFIEDVYAMSKPDLKGRADVALMVKINNAALEPRDYKIEVFSPQGALIHEHVIEGWTMQTLQHRFQVNFVSLWSPDAPALYRCSVSATEESGDVLAVSFGIKSFKATDRGFELNGRPFRLRGVSRVEESPDLGRTQYADLLRSDLEKIKAAGFNTVRLGAFPAHPKTLELCDRIGLLVLEELPAWHALVQDISDPGYHQAAESQLREMISRDRNHPCVALWGLANRIESDASEARWFVERLARLAAGLDDKPVYIATSNIQRELCADLVDAVAVNCSGVALEEVKARVAETNFGPSTLVFHQGVPAYRPAGSRLAGLQGSEELQALFCMNFIDAFDSHPDVGGWVMPYLSDYRDPGNFTSGTPFVNTTGLLKRDRTEKPAYRAVAGLLRNGDRARLGVRPVKLPTTSFSKITGAAVFLVCAALFAMHPAAAAKLAYHPREFSRLVYPAFFATVPLSLLFTLGWAVIVNRYFRFAPGRALGALDRPYFAIISFVFRSEPIIFLFMYASLSYFWIVDTTILHIFLRDFSFPELLNLTAGFTLPTIVFALPAFLGLRLRYAFLIFLPWMCYIAYTALGLFGSLLFVIIGPAVIVGVPVALIERKFRILKYMKRALSAR